MHLNVITPQTDIIRTMNETELNSYQFTVGKVQWDKTVCHHHDQIIKPH